MSEYRGDSLSLPAAFSLRERVVVITGAGSGMGRACAKVFATAGAVVMYDRLITVGRFAERPVAAGGPKEPFRPKAGHEWGTPVLRHPGPGARPFIQPLKRG